MNTTKSFTETDLRHFSGSENWYRIPLFGNATVTDGVHFIMERGCSWMATDILAVVKTHPKCRGEEFISIKYHKNHDGQSMIEYTDGNDKRLYVQTYESDACPVMDIAFYFTNNVLMLTSEY